MKIPFDIKYRPQIESGEYKVETMDGEPVRIICWDSPINKERPIIAIVFDDQIEQYKADGHYDNDYETCNYDLFIVRPEEELTEFEKELESFYNHHLRVCTYDNQGTVEDSLHDWASKLLAISRKELLSEKMLIGQTYNPDINKAHELGRKEGILLGKAEALKEIEQDPESSYAFKRGVEYGKEEALKDLPKWKKAAASFGNYSIAPTDTGQLCLLIDGYYIMLSELKKLPGFNE